MRPIGNARAGRWLLFAWAACAAAGCGPLHVDTAPGLPRCIGDAGSPVVWDRPAAPRSELDEWCAAVGSPVVIARTTAQPAREIRQLVVLSWNVHVGGGRVAALTRMIKERTSELGGDVGLVLLLQETFRGGASVGVLPDGARVPGAIRPDRPADDVVQLARELSMSAFYVPSMRNGDSSSVYEQEDRGAAILSTEPLSGLTAVELPFGKQRRVAVMATVTPRNAAAKPLRVVSAHFDVVVFGGGATRQARHLAERIPVLNPERLPVVIGVDANAIRGIRHGTVQALANVVPRVTKCGSGRTAGWVRRLDFIFSDLADAEIAHCETLQDRYGSDHRPVLMRLDYPAGPSSAR